jgi:hypothetical protein
MYISRLKVGVWRLDSRCTVGERQPSSHAGSSLRIHSTCHWQAVVRLCRLPGVSLLSRSVSAVGCVSRPFVVVLCDPSGIAQLPPRLPHLPSCSFPSGSLAVTSCLSVSDGLLPRAQGPLVPAERAGYGECAPGRDFPRTVGCTGVQTPLATCNLHFGHFCFFVDLEPRSNLHLYIPILGYVVRHGVLY